MKLLYSFIKNTVFIIVFYMCFLNIAGAYDLTAKDTRMINTIEKKLLKVINDRRGITLNIILDKIDIIQSNIQDERLLTIYNTLEWDIAANYDLDLFGITISDTPLLKTSDFRSQFGWLDGKTLNFDEYWEIDAVEHIALEWSVVHINSQLEGDIYSLDTEEYPVENSLFTHASFISDISYKKPAIREKKLASREEIITKLKSTLWVDYVWWGNTLVWAPSLLDVFPPSSSISEMKKKEWSLSGLDCSGLIYYATDGYTPRNTSWLVDYGESLDIAEKNIDEIVSLLEPLDIIVWKWHMLVVLNEIQTIESAVSYADPNLSPWVQVRNSRESIGEVLKTRIPSNSYWESEEKEFVIIRWYPESE